MIHIYDGNNVMLRDLDKVGRERIGLRRRYEMTFDNDMHIWVWDGANHNQRRRDIYPQYKMQRDPMAEDRFAQIGLFRELLDHSPATQVRCRGWEADDVIGQLVHKFVSHRKNTRPDGMGGESANLQVTVHTNDLDYWQLMQYRGVTIDGIRMEGVPNCEPHHIPLYKALVGDKSDNIDGIPGFGPKSWDALTPPDRKLLLRILEGDEPVERIQDLPLKTRPRNLLLDKANRELAVRCMSITRFLHVPEDELEKGITVGTPNRDAARKLLREFLL